MARDPYSVLGVPPGSDAVTIRHAYRQRARDLHPDRAGNDPRAAARMAELNAAYESLRRQPRTSPTPGPSTTPSGHNPPAAPPPAVAARFPWGLVAGVAAVGSLVVIAGALFGSPEDPLQPDGVLRIGSCIRVDDAAFAIEVPCSDPAAAYSVRAIIPTDTTCGAGDTGYLDRLGLGRVCVDPL